MSVRWHLGTVGFGYKEWQGAFYPAAMAPRNYLAYYSERFDAVEIDSTFYGPPRAEQLARWAAVTPDDFSFALKTPQQITHDRRLVEAVDPMLAFVDVARTLGDKLGPLLIQLPPDFTVSQTTTLMRFLQALPDDVRYAVEFRDRSWDTPGTVALLTNLKVAWVTADYVHMAKKVQRTTDFLYVRWLGRHGRYTTKDSEKRDPTEDLQRWLRRVEPHLDAVTAVYGYFNNDFAGYAPATTNRFKELVGLPPGDLRLMQQGRLL